MLKYVFVLALILLVTACSQSTLTKGRQLADEGQYESAIETLYSEIKADPKNADAWSELGIAFFKKGDLDKAEDALQQANGIKPSARTNLYAGLIHEKQGETDLAINAYRAAMGLNPKSKTRDMLRGRLDFLISQNIKKEVSFAISNEANIDADTIPNNSIAVVDFDNTHLPPELAPISKGLAEFTALDLAKVSSLKVVDRLKIDAIMKELQLGTSGYVAPSSAPRLGRLIGSKRIVTGSLVGLGDGVIRLDGAVVDTKDSLTETTKPTEASTEKFFQLEKAFVFDVIDNLGITLTPEERDAINVVPTESYLAFMAYCRGLEYESQGQPQLAKQQYQIAARNDVGFKQAQTKKQDVGRIATAAGAPTGTVEQFETAVVSTEQAVGEALDQFQAGVLGTAGFIQFDDFINQYGETIFSPLRTFFGTEVIILIRGNLDAGN